MRIDQTDQTDEYSYDEYVKKMYQKGYYVERYNIDLVSEEVYCVENKILIVPAYVEEEDKIYVFTGTSQKKRMLSEPTMFKLYIKDIECKEFLDGDNIMLSMVRQKDVVNLYTRNYATWKFGLTFDKGINLNSDKFLMFQTQKDIGKFDIEIRNIDLFRHKIKVENKYDKMIWLE